MHSKKPSLPSIQFLLSHQNEGDSQETETMIHPPATLSHSRGTSYSSLHSNSSSESMSSGCPSSTLTTPTAAAAAAAAAAGQQSSSCSSSSSSSCSSSCSSSNHHPSSMSSLPFELQQLSLSAPSQPPAPAPTPATAPPSCVQTSSTLRLLEDRPSWMLAPPSSAYPYPPLMTPSHKRRGRPSGASHGRSMSDFYLSHPLTPRPTPLSPYHSPSSLYYPRQEQLPTPPTPSALLLSSSSSKPSFQKHRRTVSANPPRTLSVPPLPPPPPQEAAAAAAAAAAAPEKETMTLLVPMDSGARAQTQSPPSYDVPFQQQQELLHEALNMTSSSKAPVKGGGGGGGGGLLGRRRFPREEKEDPPDVVWVREKHLEDEAREHDEEAEAEAEEEEEEEKEKEKEEKKHRTTTTTEDKTQYTTSFLVSRNEHTGKYSCPYCQKAFNRPSSLKIHTYSHTGEKPFVCHEEGCGRQFSVQSNMRRHLRVHSRRRHKLAAAMAAAHRHPLEPLEAAAAAAKYNHRKKTTTTTTAIKGRRKGGGGGAAGRGEKDPIPIIE